jgi:hypothetical protein
MEDQSSSKRRKVGEGDTSSQNLSGIQDRSGAGGDVLPAGTKLTEDMFMFVQQKDEFQKLLLEGEEIKGASEEQKSASRAIAVSRKFNDFLHEFGKMVDRNWKNKVPNSVKRLVDFPVTLEDVKKFHESTVTVKSTKFYTFMNQAALAYYDPKFEDVKKKYSVIWDKDVNKEVKVWKNWYDMIYCKRDVIPSADDESANAFELKVAYAFREQLGMSDVVQGPRFQGDLGVDNAGPDSKVLVQAKRNLDKFPTEDFFKVYGKFTINMSHLRDWTLVFVTSCGFTSKLIELADQNECCLFSLPRGIDSKLHSENKFAVNLINNRLSAASTSSSTAGATSASLAPQSSRTTGSSAAVMPMRSGSSSSGISAAVRSIPMRSSSRSSANSAAVGPIPLSSSLETTISNDTDLVGGSQITSLSAGQIGRGDNDGGGGGDDEEEEEPADGAPTKNQKKPRRHKSDNGPKRADLLPELGINFWEVGKNAEGRTEYEWTCKECYPDKPQGPHLKSHIEHAVKKHTEAFDKLRADHGIPKTSRAKKGDKPLGQ